MELPDLENKKVVIDLGRDKIKEEYNKNMQEHLKKKKKELDKLENDKIVATMSKIYNQHNRNTPIETESEGFRKIFA